jgi:hypothetical protein
MELQDPYRRAGPDPSPPAPRWTVLGDPEEERETEEPVVARRAARHDIEELPLATRLRGLAWLILVIALTGALSALAVWGAAHLVNQEIQQYLKP